MTKEEAERELRSYAATIAGRDRMIGRALDAGLTTNAIHALSGIARTTIYRAEEKAMTETVPATWYITEDQVSDPAYVEPGAAAVAIPAEVADWAGENGVGDGTSAYLLVSTEPGAFTPFSVLAEMTGAVSLRDAGRIADHSEMLSADR